MAKKTPDSSDGAGLKPPTRKQFKYARDLAAATGADIPNGVLHDRRQMIGFISALRSVQAKQA